jgi:acyl-CoA synthetase (AMP-forming)/AMP-acid ligase II
VNIADKIAYRAKLEPEQPAIIAGNSVVTFGMLESAVRSVGARIATFALQPGSVVAVSIKAPARHLAVTLALMRMGLVSAPFANEAALANLGQPAMALADQPFPMAGGRLCLVVDDEWFSGPGAPLPPLRSEPDAPCRIVMSSGTTGRPKPLLLSMATLEWQLYGVELQLTASGQWSRGLVMMDLNASWAASRTTPSTTTTTTTATTRVC